MTDFVVPTCPHCGAPVRGLVDGGCPFCHTPLVARDDKNTAFPQGAPSGAVVLRGVGRNKIAVIKAIREHTGLGLKEAKDLADAADRAPTTVATGLDRSRADAFVADLIDAGADAG